MIQSSSTQCHPAAIPPARQQQQKPAIMRIKMSVTDPASTSGSPISLGTAPKRTVHPAVIWKEQAPFFTTHGHCSAGRGGYKVTMQQQN